MAYPKGKPKSEESKVKASKSCKKAWTEEKKKVRSEAYTSEKNPFYGRKHTEETIEKLRTASTGKIASAETKQKISNTLVGNQRALGNKFSLTIKQRKHLSNSKKGEKNHFWKGGITKINKLIRNSIEYKLWRESVFQRDDWTCQVCEEKPRGEKFVVLNAHHKKPFSKFSELRFDIDNGITLCLDCHKMTESYGRCFGNENNI